MSARPAKRISGKSTPPKRAMAERRAVGSSAKAKATGKSKSKVKIKVKARVKAKGKAKNDDVVDDLRVVPTVHGVGDAELDELGEVGEGGFGLEGADGGKSVLKEDPVLDRRIIEGMLRDRKILLDELAGEGMTQGQVLRRAAELGLSEALLRQVKGVAADLAGERPGRRAAPSTLGARTCLSCDRVFLSTGPGNRLCMRCRGGDAGLAQF